MENDGVFLVFIPSMYDFTEDRDNVNINDDEPIWEDSVHQLKVDSEREWTRMSNEFVNAGYREGITAGKEAAVQEGFDSGFATVGAPIGREIGNLRGLAAGLLVLLESRRPIASERGDKGELLAEIKEVANGLARLQLMDLAPPDEEALAHAEQHIESSGGQLHLSSEAFAAREKALSNLSDLRTRLRNIVDALSLGNLVPPANLS